MARKLKKTNESKKKIILYAISIFVILVIAITASKINVPKESKTQEIHEYNSGELVKGRMTLTEVSDISGIGIHHFYEEFNIPNDLPTETPLSEIKNYVPDFETSAVKEYVANFKHGGCGRHNAEDSSLFGEETHEDKDVECPYGEVNDSAPGKCSLYKDSNSNGICDLSE